MDRSSFLGGGKLEKSNSGIASSALREGDETAASGGGGPVVREQDRFMPIANVIRIMRRVLPTHAKIADDAKETVQECVSEYISFVTSEANERCQQEQRKTITAEDLLWAMSKLGFDDYVQPLTIYLQRYREAEGDSRGGLLRGEPLLKRAASDAGIFSHHAIGHDPLNHNMHMYYHPYHHHNHHHRHHQPPPLPFLLGSNGPSGGPGNGGEGSSVLAPPKDGFHPFASYK